MTPHDEQRIHDTVRDAVKQAVAAELPDIVEKQLPLTLGEVLGPMIHSAVRSDLRWVARGALVGYLILALGLGYAIHDNRVRSTKARGVVCQIITAGDSTAYAYEREGTISRAQLRRALRQAAEYRALLGPAPTCSTGLTPPPSRLPPVP